MGVESIKCVNYGTAVTSSLWAIGASAALRNNFIWDQ